MEEESLYRSTMGDAAAVSRLLRFTIVAEALGILAVMNDLMVLASDDVAGLYDERVETAHRFVRATDILVGVLPWITVAVWMVWQLRSYYNLVALGAERRFTARQILWSYSVPLINLWRPRQVLEDLWRGGASSAADRARTRLTLVPLAFIARYLAVFLAAWLITPIRTPADRRLVDVIGLGAHVVAIGLAVAAIELVTRISARHEDRAHRLGIPDALLQSPPRPWPVEGRPRR